MYPGGVKENYIFYSLYKGGDINLPLTSLFIDKYTVHYSGGYRANAAGKKKKKLEQLEELKPKTSRRCGKKLIFAKLSLVKKKKKNLVLKKEKKKT